MAHIQQQSATTQPSDHNGTLLWDYSQAYPSSFDLAQAAVGSPYMPMTSYYEPEPLPAVSDGYSTGPGDQGYSTGYFSASPADTDQLLAVDHPAQSHFDYSGQADLSSTLSPFMQQQQPPPPPPTWSQEQTGRRRATTCPVCSDTKGSARDLDRHIWAHHRDYAAVHQVPSEERPCPFPPCTYIGRKDNLARHVKAKHRGRGR